jgi:tetratricopeptide (TPR) repeat protein
VTYAESLVPLLHFGWSDLRVIREGRWKYIQAPRPELYDLSRDPGESDNRAAAEPARADALRAALGRILDDERKAGAGRSQAGPVPPELLEKLGALGYVGGVVPAETRTPGADPKDKIDDFRIANDLIREGLLRLHDRDYRASVERFQQVLERGISSFEVHFYLARGLAGLGRHREAAAHFAEAARRQPALAACWRGLAGSRAAAGDLPGALEALRAGQAALPGDAGLRIDEGQLLADAGRKPEARRVWESALPLAPRNAELRAQLGELQRDLGDVPGAIATQREAVDLAPDNASYWNALGMTLGGSGSTKDAEAAFREAVRRDEKNHRYTYNLGLILLRQGRASEARPYFEKALAADPSFAPARERLKELSSR